MAARAQAPESTPPELYRFLRWALFRLRWGTILALLLITFMQPTASRVGLPTWALILLFAGYNLLVEALRGRVPWLRPYTRVALLDLPVVGLLYGLGQEPGGPLFVLLFLAVDSAAVSMTLRGTLLYTAAVIAVAAALDLTLTLWAARAGDARLLAARLVMLALVGVGMAIVTRRLALEQETARAVRDEGERLEALARLRADFIATVSHDLRTPLTAARAGLSMLETSVDDRLGDDERELLDTSRRNVERLNLLIGDLLTFNQLEAGTLRLEREALDLRATVRAALRVVRPLLLEKGQHLTVELPAPLPHEGDPRRLEQLVVNLLADAHLRAPAGAPIAIAGRLAAGTVLLAVGADGADPRPRGERSLGLVVAGRIAALHGGSMRIEGAPGGGVRFRVTLPALADGGAP